jgi:gamma-glutamylcyclotransferase (GGCT)/AIG2-like uncharacterized protein YtfP
MHRVLADSATLVGSATVQGFLFSLGRYPALAPNEETTHTVAGEVYRIDDAALDGLLVTLDEYEGIGPETPLSHTYRRDAVTARFADGHEVQTWAYVLNRSHEGLQQIEGGDFVEWQRAR